MKKAKFKTTQEYYKEALRYYKNARERLKEARVQNDRYQDVKPVRESCATAYLAVLLTLDGYFLERGVDNEKLPDSTEGYWKNLRKYRVHNGKITDAFSIAYENLHLFGYYRGASDTHVVKSGFEKAKLIIDTLGRRKS